MSLRRAALLLFFACADCPASQIVHEARDAVRARAATGVVVDVRAVDVRDDGAYWRELALRIDPVRIVFGKALPIGTRRCVYREGRPHRRGEVTVSPLVSGSGAEFDVRRSDRVMLWLAKSGADDAADRCSILRIEAAEPKQTRTR